MPPRNPRAAANFSKLSTAAKKLAAYARLLNKILIPSKRMPRPNFTANSARASILYHNVFTAQRGHEIDVDQPGLRSMNLARGHRLSWFYIRTRVIALIDGTQLVPNRVETSTEFANWTDQFVKAGETMIAEIRQSDHPQRNDLLEAAQASQTEFVRARARVLTNPDSVSLHAFLIEAFSFHANIKGLTPDHHVNGPIGEHNHFNFRLRRGLTIQTNFKNDISAASVAGDVVLTPVSEQLAPLTPVPGVHLPMKGNLVLGQQNFFSENLLAPSKLAQLKLAKLKEIEGARLATYGNMSIIGPFNKNAPSLSSNNNTSSSSGSSSLSLSSNNNTSSSNNTSNINYLPAQSNNNNNALNNAFQNNNAFNSNTLNNNPQSNNNHHLPSQSNNNNTLNINHYLPTNYLPVQPNIIQYLLSQPHIIQYLLSQPNGNNTLINSAFNNHLRVNNNQPTNLGYNRFNNYQPQFNNTLNNNNNTLNNISQNNNMHQVTTQVSQNQNLQRMTGQKRGAIAAFNPPNKKQAP